ncbi:MAG: transglycosylase SLT domain-containing protein [Spirochaetales bacterium]|nr:transglycosylase SLT domain-containing protein [Spirochaetales bacterium]
MNHSHSPNVLLSLFMLSVMVLTLTVYASNDPSATDADEFLYVPVDFKALSDLAASDFRDAMRVKTRSDHVASYFRDPDTRPLTLAFFEQLTGNYAVSQAILEEATMHGIPATLAFALASTESGFEPRAFNRNTDSSVDRGVFQLNSRSFPSLSIEDFYDIPTNVHHGIAHLSFCLASGGNEVAALAVYNAGLGRVSKSGTPRRTLDYINDILVYRDRLDALFEAQVVARHIEARALAAVDIP